MLIKKVVTLITEIIYVFFEHKLSLINRKLFIING